MAVKKVTNRESRIKMLNKALLLMAQTRGYMTAAILSQRLKRSKPTMSAALKTLRDMGRIDNLQNVLNAKDITEKEYANFGYPYGKKAKGRRKANGKRIVKGSKRKPVHTASAATASEIRKALGIPKHMTEGTLLPPIEEANAKVILENSFGNVTITGKAGEVVGFLNKLKDAGILEG